MRIFQRLSSFGDRKHSHFMAFAEIEAAGQTRLPTFSITECRYRKRQTRRGVGNHLRIKVAAFTGVDLNGRRACGANTRGVVHRLLVAFNNGAGTLLSAFSVSVSSVVLPEPGWNQVQHQLLRAAKRARLRAARRLFLSSTSISTSSIRRWLMPGAWVLAVAVVQVARFGLARGKRSSPGNIQRWTRGGAKGRAAKRRVGIMLIPSIYRLPSAQPQVVHIATPIFFSILLRCCVAIRHMPVGWIAARIRRWLTTGL
jgi:hypothetical protein